MAQVDLGLRLFLMDDATGSLGSFIGTLTTFGQVLYNLMAIPFNEQIQASSQALQDATLAYNAAQKEVDGYEASIERMYIKQGVVQNALEDTRVEMNYLTQQFTSGAITQAEYDSQMELLTQKMANLGGQAYLLEKDVEGASLALDEAQANANMFGLQVAGAASAVDDAKAGLDGLLASLTPIIGLIGGGALDFLGFSSALKTATQDAADFQDAMVKVSLAVQGTDQNFQGLSDYLTNLANNSVYSTTELADGFQLLGERGYTASQILDGNMGASLTNLSEAIGATGSQGVVGAAGLLSTAMELWHVNFTDSAHYADLLTYAFYNGIPSADSLRSALEAVGGRAQLLGIPLDQVVVSLDALARAGMQGSQAGASLNYFLTALSSPIPKAQAELASLGLLVVNQTTPAFKDFAAKLYAAEAAAGQTKTAFDGSVKSLDNMFTAAQNLGLISLDQNFQQWAIGLGILNSKFYDAKGNFVGLIPALDMLSQKLKGMNAEEQASVLSQLFNVKSGQGAVQLIDNLLKLHQNYQAVKQSADEHNLSMTDAQKITDTYNASLKQLGTTWTDFMKTFGTPFIQALTPIIQGFNSFIGGLTMMMKGSAGFVAQFLVVGAVLSVVAIVIGIIVAIVAFAGTAIGAALLPIIGVILLVAAAIPFLAAGIVGLIHWFQQITAAGTPLGDFFRQLGVVFDSTFKELANQWAYFGSILSVQLTMLSHAFAPLMNALKQTIPLWQWLGIIIGGAIGLVLIVVAGGLIGILHGLILGLIGFASGMITFFSGIVRMIAGIVQLLVGIVKFIGGLFVGMFTGNWSLMQAGLHEMGRGILNIFLGIGQAVVGVVQAAFGFIIGFVWGFIAGIISFFQHLFEVLVGHSIIPDMLKAILMWFVNIFTQVTSTIGSWISNAISLFASLPGRVMNALSGLGSLLLQAGGNMMHMLAQGIQNGIGAVTGAVGNAAHTIAGWLGFKSPPKMGILADSDTYMPNMMKMYAAGITQHTPLLQSALRGAATALSPTGFTSPAIQSMNTAYAASSGIGAGASGSRTSTFNFNIDGKPVATCVMDWVTGQMQMNGMQRTLR